MSDNIHPIFDTILSTEKKENLLKQKSIVVWMVGLSGSGKSTIAEGLEKTLHQRGFLTALLDGDNLRTGVNNNLSFSQPDRIENIRRAAEVSKLFVSNGVITICSLISPTTEIRQMAKDIIGEKYCEVFIKCPLEVCEQRDVKGLYAKARKGEIPDFTGISSPFEEPNNPDIVIDTEKESIEKSLETLVTKIIEKIKI
ncbi:adenylyl-sulfate kinase [Fulvivirga sp. RKSG066]|uniref:adenylyl-sulfate kinase n=1 Tax=Fulvivirga aurantia TaxID=2529383 RepID=UPI0012BD1276|nr:adenylyl-sulfate kinase [Fulvivirga aurantia]MTI21595.1 adenylyl-sulfate kinase [Fulvivirga aurantia]